MTIQQQQEHDFDAYYEYLRSKQINIAPDMGMIATNVLLSPVTFGVVEAASPNKISNREFMVPATVEPREIGSRALAKVIDIEQMRLQHPPVVDLAQNSLNSVA